MTTENAPIESEIQASVSEVAPVAEAVAEAAVPVETPAAEAPKVEEHTSVPTLLSDAVEEKVDPAPEEKPAEEQAETKAEVKPEEKPEEKPAEKDQVAQQPVALTAQDFVLPEGIAADERLGEFATKATELGLSKEVAQSLLDMHTQSLKTFAEQTVQQASAEQHRIFGETRAGWRKDVMADEQIGGAGHKTAMGAIARMRDLLVPEKDRAAFNEFLMVTGAGDHPAMLKLLHNAARHFDEGPAVPASKPPPDIGRAPGKRGMKALYDKTGS